MKFLNHRRTGAGSSLPRWKRVVFAAIPAALVLVIVFSASELYFGVTRPSLDLDVLTGRKVGESPMATWAQVDAFCAYRGKPGDIRYWDQGRKTINRHGFMSTPDLDVQKPPNTIRVAFLGGSSTAGTGRNLADVETWPFKVAELLKKRNPGVRVEYINAALGGYSTFESYGRLWSRLRFFEPDIAIVYHGWNDLGYFCNADNLENYRTRPDGSWSLGKMSSAVRVLEPWPIDPMIKWSATLSAARVRLAGPFNGEASPVSEDVELRTEWDPRALEAFRTNLRLLRESSRTLGIELFVAKQATMIVTDLPTQYRERCNYQVSKLDHDANVRAFEALYRVIDDEFPEGRVIDVTPLSGDPDIFLDHIHVNSRGTSRIAALVADVIGPLFDGLAAGLIDRVDPPQRERRGSNPRGSSP
jgi:lysophospholipase L1-like esterase